MPANVKIGEKSKNTYLQIAKNDAKSQKIFEEMYAEGLRNHLYNDKTLSYFEVVQPRTAQGIKDENSREVV